MIFATVNKNKGDVTRNARVYSTNCLRYETKQRAFAESKHNHETALKFYAPLSVYRSAVETQVCSSGEGEFLSLAQLWSYS